MSNEISVREALSVATKSLRELEKLVQPSISDRAFAALAKFIDVQMRRIDEVAQEGRAAQARGDRWKAAALRLEAAVADIHDERPETDILCKDGFTKSYHKGSVADLVVTTCRNEVLWLRDYEAGIRKEGPK